MRIVVNSASHSLARPQAFHDFFGSLAYFAVEVCFLSGIETCLPDMSVKGSRSAMTCMTTDAV